MLPRGSDCLIAGEGRQFISPPYRFRDEVRMVSNDRADFGHRLDLNSWYPDLVLLYFLFFEYLESKGGQDHVEN